MKNEPSSPLTISRYCPDASFFATTVTPGSTAFCASTTLPRNSPVPCCPYADPTTSSQTPRAAAVTDANRCMKPLRVPSCRMSDRKPSKWWQEAGTPGEARPPLSTDAARLTSELLVKHERRIDTTPVFHCQRLFRAECCRASSEGSYPACYPNF